MNSILNEQAIAKIKESNNRFNKYLNRKKKADKHNREDLTDLVELVNSILSKHGISDTITTNHIRFNADFVGNITFIDDKKLSKIIFDSVYPKPVDDEYSHYTGFNAGMNILDKGEFWLFNLLNNFSAGEFRSFYQDHGLKGYEKTKTTFGIRSDYETLMSEIFALCLTSETNKSDSLWTCFGESGTGLKLTFEIDSKIPDFRQVYYSDSKKPKKIPLLNDLFTDINDKYKYPFNFSYMSKIGAFYIKGKFSNEDEYRFLIKLSADNYNARNLIPVTYQRNISYIIIPFESQFASFKLKKVTKGPNFNSTNNKALKSLIDKNYPDAILE